MSFSDSNLPMLVAQVNEFSRKPKNYVRDVHACKDRLRTFAPLHWLGGQGFGFLNALKKIFALRLNFLCQKSDSGSDVTGDLQRVSLTS